MVAVDGDPRTVISTTLLGTRQPDRIWPVRQSAADAALAFGTPFVSGKDSLNNEYRDRASARPSAHVADHRARARARIAPLDG